MTGTATMTPAEADAILARLRQAAADTRRELDHDVLPPAVVRAKAAQLERLKAAVFAAGLAHSALVGAARRLAEAEEWQMTLTAADVELERLERDSVDPASVADDAADQARAVRSELAANRRSLRDGCGAEEGGGAVPSTLRMASRLLIALGVSARPGMDPRDVLATRRGLTANGAHIADLRRAIAEAAKELGDAAAAAAQ